MTLYLCPNFLGVRIFTRLPPEESAVIGDVAELVLPGEEFGGLTYDELAKLATTYGKVDSDSLHTE